MEKDYYYTGYNKNLKSAARDLRKNMTRQEKHLWYDFLRKYPVKWYRQRAIEQYIADFYCSSAKLVVELDGSQHYTEQGLECDAVRAEVFRTHGIEILRFSNLEVDQHFESVCEVIDAKVKERT